MYMWNEETNTREEVNIQSVVRCFTSLPALTSLCANSEAKYAA